MKKIRLRVEKFIKRLGLSDKVVLKGDVSRFERLRIVAESSFMLYPSHIDAFPYSVLESLYLGTPVVAYDIPALRIYYGDNPGVKLVEEGNLEALLSESLNMLESRHIDIKLPRLRTWSEIMQEELNLVERLIERY